MDSDFWLLKSSAGVAIHWCLHLIILVYLSLQNPVAPYEISQPDANFVAIPSWIWIQPLHYGNVYVTYLLTVIIASSIGPPRIAHGNVIVCLGSRDLDCLCLRLQARRYVCICSLTHIAAQSADMPHRCDTNRSKDPCWCPHPYIGARLYDRFTIGLQVCIINTIDATYAHPGKWQSDSTSDPNDGARIFI